MGDWGAHISLRPARGFHPCQEVSHRIGRPMNPAHPSLFILTTRALGGEWTALAVQEPLSSTPSCVAVRREHGVGKVRQPDVYLSIPLQWFHRVRRAWLTNALPRLFTTIRRSLLGQLCVLSVGDCAVCAQRSRSYDNASGI